MPICSTWNCTTPERRCSSRSARKITLRTVESGPRPERLLVNSAGDWGPSKPTAVPDFILAMRLRGHPESLIRRIVYDNPLKFFSQSRNFDFTPPEVDQPESP